MIGVTVAVLLACSMFVMGVLAMHWRADHLMLWEANLTKENVTIALQYYASTIGIAPQRYAHRLMAIGSIQIVILLLKMFTGGANNLLFDGASLCTYFFRFSHTVLILASSVLFFSKIQPCTCPLPLTHIQASKRSLPLCRHLLR